MLFAHVQSGHIGTVDARRTCIYTTEQAPYDSLLTQYLILNYAGMRRNDCRDSACYTTTNIILIMASLYVYLMSICSLRWKLHKT